MTQNKNNYVLLAIVAFLLAACTKELPYPDVEDADLMVVNSLFSPDGDFIVHVSKSCHVQNTTCTESNLTDAEVTVLSPQGEQLTILEHQGEGIYQNLNFQIDAEKEYHLEVKSTGGLEGVTSKGRVPTAPVAELLSVEEGEMESEIVWIFEIEIDDDADEENYYLIEGTFDTPWGHYEGVESEINGYLEPHFGHYSDDPNSENKEIASGHDFTTYALRSVYLPDKNFNGQKYKTSFGIRDWDLPPRGVTANIYVKSVSKEMYEYHKTLDLHRINSNNVFSEPQQIYSNIENGLGIFAGYNQKHLTVELPDSKFSFPNNIWLDNDGCTASCTVSFNTDGGADLNYSWDFGDGSLSDEPNPDHTYTEPGTYNCFLAVRKGGDSFTSDFQVTIK